MKLKKAIVALLLAVTMVVPMALSAGAMSKTQYDCNRDGKVSYLSLGDSIAGGFGLPDYNKYGKTLIYGKVIKGAYPTLLANTLGVDSFAPYAIPGMRSEDIKYLIGASSNPDWVARRQFPNISGNAFDAATLAAMRPAYISAVKNADIITLDIGFNDMWMPTIACIYEIAEYGKLTGRDPAETILDRVEKYGSTTALVQNAVNYLVAWSTRPDQWAKFCYYWASSFTKWCAAYAVNLDIIAARIKMLNPNAKVLIPQKFNVFKGWDALPLVNDNTLGNLMQPIFSLYNLKARSVALRYGFTFVETGDVELASQDHLAVPLYEFMDNEGGFLKFNPHPTARGHRQIANALVRAL